MFINANYDNVSREEFEPFFKRAYREGSFLHAHKKSSGKWINILNKTKIRQIAARGVGGIPLIGSIAAMAPYDINTGVIRDKPKGYGANKSIEGSIESNKSTLLIDDVLNGGISARKSIEVLKKNGFSNIVFATLMIFEWGKGRSRLGIDKNELLYFYGIRISKMKKQSVG